jgi:hypothetical protein
MKTTLPLFAAAAMLLGASGLAAAAERGNAAPVDLRAAIPAVGPVFLPQAGYSGDLTLLGRPATARALPPVAKTNAVQVVSRMTPELRAQAGVYRLAHHDLISVRVYGEPKLGGDRLRIDSSGRVLVAGSLTPVRVVGLTTKEAEEALASALRAAGQGGDVRVNVVIDEYAPGPPAP